MTYMASHDRVRRIRGRAQGYTCPCGKQAQEWAYVPSPRECVDKDGRRYSPDPDDYTAMCFRCHRLFDKAAITHCPQGHEYTPDNTLLDAGKRKCKTCVYERNRRRPMSPESKAKKADYQRRQAAARRAAA